MYLPIVNVPLIGMPGMMEWVLIGLAVVLFFGATKLPKLGKGLGEGIRNFKKGIKGELEEGEGDDAESDSKKQIEAAEKPQADEEDSSKEGE